MRLQYVGQSAKAKSVSASDIRLINAYSEIVEHKQAKSLLTIYRTPGLKFLQTLSGAGQVRGLFYAASQDRTFAVQGSALFELIAADNHLFRGNLLTIEGPVDFEENGVHLVVVDGEARYSLTFSTNVFSANTDVDYPAASRVGFIDQRFIFLTPHSQQFAWSDLLSTDVQPLNVASAEGRPDPLVSLLVLHREIWLFGTETTQPFYSTGDPDTPFAPIGSVFLHQGCAAPQSPAKVGETLCWLTRNDEGHGMVVQAAGQNVQRVSTHAVEEAIQSYPQIDDALAWSYQYEGHTWYHLTFPSANATWVLDTSTSLWFELSSYDPVTGFPSRHRANCYTFAFHQHLVGDYVSGQLYALDGKTYDEAGAPLVLEAILPPLFDGEGGSLIEQTWLLVEAETGVGLDGGLVPGADPQISLLVSDDGGHLYGPALQRSLGPLGKTKHVVEWRALGSAWDRRCKLIVSDPVKVAITGALTDVRPLAR